MATSEAKRQKAHSILQGSKKDHISVNQWSGIGLKNLSRILNQN